LDLLREEDAASLPDDLARQTPSLVQQCNATVRELNKSLTTKSGDAEHGMSQWLEHRQQIAELQIVLEGFRMTLGEALDVIAL
jgi:hypothetical protein